MQEHIPPQKLDLERAVLGSILIHEEAMAVVVRLLSPDDFYSHSHQIIYKAMHDLFDRGDLVDSLSVCDRVRASGELERVGGASYLADLTAEVASAANVEYYAQKVRDCALRRRILVFCQRASQSVYDESLATEEMVADASKELVDLLQRSSSGRDVRLPDALDEVLEYYESVRYGGLTGLATGFAELDAMTGGLQKGDLIIVGGRPSMGKTWLMCNMLHHIARSGTCVGVFSLEMPAWQISRRLLAIHTGVYRQDAYRGQLTDEEWKRLIAGIGRLAEEPVIFDGSFELTISSLRARALQWKAQYHLGCVFVDYLQLITQSAESRTQEITKISKGLKALARELDAPVVVVSQLSRLVDQRPGLHRPKLSDLRESGSIEQDADVVLFPWRPWYYMKELTLDEQARHLKSNREQYGEHDATIMVAKQRNGPTGDVDVQFFDQRGFWPVERYRSEAA